MASRVLTLAGGIRRHATLASAVLVLAAAWWWQLAALREAHELAWLVVTAFSVITGFIALGWLRPAQVGITAPQAMMLLGTLGMLAGLSIDTQRAGLAALSSVCATAPPDFLSIARLHLAWLPWMHGGMILGGLGALVWLRTARPNCRRQFCARFVQNVACSAWMLAGMVAGVALYYRLVPLIGSGGVATMLGGMIGGMVWGMVVSVLIYRVYFGARANGRPHLER